MRKIFILFLVPIVALSLYAFKENSVEEPEWKIVWEENFDIDGVIDTTIWSKIPRGKVDWNNYMSDADVLFDVKDGNLILSGIVNPDTTIDKVPYITGGIFTKDNKGFSDGKLEIKAKLGNAKGAWPAIWLLPFNNEEWPYGGEIDIMERLNFDSIAYQTVHSYYTYVLGLEDSPKHGTTGPINVDEYNVYGVEMNSDSLVFYINGNKTFTYPRIETDLEGQFPFNKDFYLLIDMQLEGSWVGQADPADLPVSMYVDWVKFYKK